VPIEEVWAPRGSDRDPCVAALARVARRGASYLAAGDRRRAAGFDLLVLHPEAESRGSDNERSLVLRASAAGRRLLLAADVSAREEGEMLRRMPGELAADLLKVPHHGSAGSSSERFVAAVGARLAVVSAGVANPYGHPSPAALSRLGRACAVVLRTERDGEVSVAWRAGQPLRIGLPGSPRRVGPAT
jgi:competence protein ComEC